MVFSSLIFLNLFLPVFFLVYLLVPQSQVSAKNLVLLIFSLLFYSWGEPGVVLYMILCILVNWCAGLLLSKGDAGEQKQSGGLQPKLVLAGTIAVSIGLLGYFKYANFVATNLHNLFSWVAIEIPTSISDFKTVALPIGISFYTFQALSYTIDVYRGIVPANRNLLNFACYVSMFPQLVAGPIVRYRDVATQLSDRRVSPSQFAFGIRRFTVGLTKKVLIANLLAVPADVIFALPQQQLSMSLAWLGCLTYTLQIYFDFSAYSDMAIGLGMMMGFTFPENFNYPYVSKSIREFWRRWHISLSTWFRDYLYIPLGGSRISPMRTYLNLWFVFLICGLWHGASWGFVLWGAYHGAFLVMERTVGPATTRGFVGFGIAKHFYTLFVVMVGWVVFRSETITQAVWFIKAMFGWSADITIARPLTEFLPPHTTAALLSGIIIATGLPYAWFGKINRYAAGNLIWEGTLLSAGSACLIISIMHLANGAYNPFIYFRF